MRVIYISQDGIAPSGITSYGHHVLAAWPEARMLLLNADQPAPTCPDELRARVVCVSQSESHGVAAVARHLGALAESMGGEVTVMPNTGDTPWSAAVAWVRSLRADDRARVRVLGVVHSDVETQYAGAVAHATFAAAWIGVSRRCAQVLGERLGGSGRPVHALPYPVAVPESAASANRDGPLRLAYVGRLEEPQKRVSRLVAVCSGLVGRGVRFSMHVAGDGPARRELQTAMAASPAAGLVEFHGSIGQPALRAILARSDVFLLVSAYEGLPLALQEAMAAGVCPVVMSMPSGVADAVEPAVNGVLVAQGDVAAMVSAIETLDRDRAALERMKAAARESARRLFEREAHFARLGAIVQACRESPPPDPEDVAPDAAAASVRRMIARLRAIGASSVAVYGAGMFGRKLVDACLAEGITIRCLVDSDPARLGFEYRGLVCRRPEEIAAMKPHPTVAVGSVEFQDEIVARVRSIMATEHVEFCDLVTARDDP